MKVFVLVNRINEIGATQTTTYIINEAAKREYETVVCDIFCLANVNRTTFEIRGHKISSRTVPDAHKDCQNPNLKNYVVQSEDLFLIRTSPGRDDQYLSHHLTWLQVLSHFKSFKYRVVNDPDALMKLMSKSYLLGGLSKWLPDGYIASPPLPDSKNKRVAKPLFGSRGIGVHMLDTEKMAEKEEDILCIQEFLEDVHKGEHRVLALDGQLIRKSSVYGAYKKKAKDGEFRHNLAQGAVPIESSLDESQIKVSEEISLWSYENQLKFVGMDIVGTKLLELNVFSPGGIDAIIKTSGVDFTEEIFNCLIDC